MRSAFIPESEVPRARVRSACSSCGVQLEGNNVPAGRRVGTRNIEKVQLRISNGFAVRREIERKR